MRTMKQELAFQRFAVALQGLKARQAQTGQPLLDKVARQLSTTNKIKQLEAKK